MCFCEDLSSLLLGDNDELSQLVQYVFVMSDEDAICDAVRSSWVVPGLVPVLLQRWVFLLLLYKGALATVGMDCCCGCLRGFFVWDFRQVSICLDVVPGGDVISIGLFSLPVSLSLLCCCLGLCSSHCIHQV